MDAVARLKDYGRLIRLDKPIGIFLLLWPTLWALWIASDGFPQLSLLLIFIAGVVLTRSAGCIFNDLADQRYDGHVKRTQQRPLATGQVSRFEAYSLAAFFLLMAFNLVLLLNILTLELAFIGAVLMIIYPFMKRFIHLPQAILGLAYSWGIPMAFAAQTNQVPLIAWLLFATAGLWSIAYDTMYAMVDRDDDIKIGVKSSAILFGKQDRLIIACLQFSLLGLLVLIGNLLQFNFWYFLSLAIAAGLAIYQQVLIINREPEKCFQAFLNNNWFGLTIFFGILISYLSMRIY